MGQLLFYRFCLAVVRQCRTFAEQIDATFIKELKKFVTSGSDFVFIFVIHAYFSGYIIFL